MSGWRGLTCGACLCLAAGMVRGGTGIDATNRHAWSENAGWLTFAPSNADVTVAFDGTSGWLAGHAWSENAGWLKLGADAGGPYANSGALNWGVNLAADGTLTGFAWGENMGWVRLDPAHGGVTLDMETGRLDGYAWGENIGWIRLQGQAPDYGVRTEAFDRQVHGTPNWWLARYGVAETQDEGDGVPAWREYVADTDPTNGLSRFVIDAVSNLPPVTVYFASSARRYYVLETGAALDADDWTGGVARVGVGGRDALESTNANDAAFLRIRVREMP